MAATHFICGLKRVLATLVAACALSLVLAGTALAGNGNGNGGGNGNGCNANGNAYGHTGCPDGIPTPPPPPPPPSVPPAGGDSAPPSSDPALPSSDSTPPSDASAPNSGTGSGSGGGDASPSGGPTDSSPGSDGSSSSSAPSDGGSTGNSTDTPPSGNGPAPPAPPDPGPPAPVAGWAPLVSKQEQPAAPPAPRPTAPRGRTFSSTHAPDASWGEPDASWNNSVAAERYGVTGTGAIITIRRRHGVFGGLSFRVSLAPGSSSLVFRAARSVVAGSGGRLYRIGAWLRTVTPGMNVCLRIQEVSPADPLTAVRTTESCFAPTVQWKRFVLYRRTLARGNRLVFSIYSFGAVSGDSFDIDGFTVARRVQHGWKRVDAAFGDAELR